MQNEKKKANNSKFSERLETTRLLYVFLSYSSLHWLTVQIHFRGFGFLLPTSMLHKIRTIWFLLHYFVLTVHLGGWRFFKSFSLISRVTNTRFFLIFFIQKKTKTFIRTHTITWVFEIWHVDAVDFWPDGIRATLLATENFIKGVGIHSHWRECCIKIIWTLQKAKKKLRQLLALITFHLASK